MVLVKFTNTFVFKPLIFALTLEITLHHTPYTMYLKFIRHQSPGEAVLQGTLYRVHFQPNEKGGYNETLFPISDVYEKPYGDGMPLPLIYPVGVVQIDGILHMTVGNGTHRSALFLLDRDVRDTFLPALRTALLQREDCRLEIL